MSKGFKGTWDSSPLSLKEKLFYGIRKNETPRGERNYPTGNIRTEIPKKAMNLRSGL